MARADISLVLSSEHGGNRIPARYRHLFRGAASVLKSHRGWDPGSLELARAIARITGAPLTFTTTSRLLVECNRSPGHPRLFSEFTRNLDESEKQRVLKTCYHPHRGAVRAHVRNALRMSKRVVHVGVHTFTPVYEGRTRTVDIGILYDPRQTFETGVACALAERLRASLPGLRVKRNIPYRGWTDGLVTALRAEFPASRYAGIELEVSQGLVGGREWQRLQREIAIAIANVASR